MSFLDEMDELSQIGNYIENKKNLMLSRAGWEYSSAYPDFCWRWAKLLPDGKRITCDASEAIRVESYLRPSAERDKYDDDHEADSG